MPNNYFEFTDDFVPGTKARSGEVDAQFLALEAAFDLLPTTPGSISRGTSTVGTESGSGNSYVVTMPNTRASNQNGDIVIFRATHSNTGASTLNVDGIGAVSMRDHADSELADGAIVSGRWYSVRYDSALSHFLMTDAADGAGQVTYAAEWANKAHNSLISTAAGGDGVDDYSAKHWATEAATSAAGIGASNLSYRGTHDASGDTAPAGPADRSVYRISVAGTFSGITWRAGDYAMYNGSDWERVSRGADAALTTIANSFAATQTMTGLSVGGNAAVGGVFTIVGTNPVALWVETGVTANNTTWEASADGEQWRLRLVNDAVSSGATAIAIERTANVVDEIELNATTLDLNGSLTVSGDVLAGDGVVSVLGTSRSAFKTSSANPAVYRSTTGHSTIGGLSDSGSLVLAARNNAATQGIFFVAGQSGSSEAVVAGIGLAVAVFSPTTEFEINTTTVDINAAVDISSTLAVGGVLSVANNVRITSATPRLVFVESDASANETVHYLGPSAGDFGGWLANDAEGSFTQWLAVRRTGTTVDEIELNATTLDFNGNLDVSGTSLLTGAVTASSTLAVAGAASVTVAGTTATPALTLSSTLPNLGLRETDGPSNEKNWELRADSGTLYVLAVNDATNSTVTAVQITRTGTTIDTVDINSPLVTVNGAGATVLGVASTAAAQSYLRLSTNGTARAYVGAPGASGDLITGSAVGDLALRAEGGSVRISADAGVTSHLAISSAGVLTTPNASAAEVGYKGVPKRTVASTGSTVAADAGKLLACTGASITVTIDDAAHPDDTVISFLGVGSGGTATTIAISGSTLYLAGTGYAVSGSRTLAYGGMATAYKYGSSWVISGSGLT
jgi:hypothetical protein